MKSYEKKALDYSLTKHKNWAEICAAKDAYLQAVQDIMGDLNKEVVVEFDNGMHQLTDYARDLYLKKNNAS